MKTWWSSALPRARAARAAGRLDGASRTNHFEEDSSAVNGSLTLQPGDHGGGVTPVPIPNTAVKPSSADGTVRVAWWESRTLPGFFLRAIKPRPATAGAFLLSTPHPIPPDTSGCVGAFGGSTGVAAFRCIAPRRGRGTLRPACRFSAPWDPCFSEAFPPGVPIV